MWGKETGKGSDLWCLYAYNWHILMKLMLCLTFDPTVALLQYSLAFVLMLLGSIVSASEYSSHAAS